MGDPETPSTDEQIRALYEQAESQAADALEELVSKPSFAVLLARSAENVAALSRIGADIADLVLRNLRIAGRADVTRLSRQLHRTEDKLERLLQETEELRRELASDGTPTRLPMGRRGPGGGERARNARTRLPTQGPTLLRDQRGRRRERDRDTGARAARHVRLRERDPDDGRCGDRPIAARRGLDASRDDALPLPIKQP